MRCAFFAIIVAVFGLTPAVAIKAAGDVEFNRDVRPILAENCYTCHGGDAKEIKGKRRLDTFEGATATQKEIQAIVPGNITDSDLWLRVNSSDDDEVMPPKESHKSLTASQKDILKRWIEGGAKYQIHWAYVPPRRSALPNVKVSAWPRNEIDYFVLSRLEQENLKPSLEADKNTLIRRLSFDLTGLPPTADEINAYHADKSSGAYERLVDRLLASPHYGERMAVDWLDAARYADTNGYQVDRNRELWAWRDWVINAFNENMHFDQFTIEQLAGDLIPNPTLSQRIATGFNRNHMINEEGGIIPEEFLAEYAADRVETTATVWLGQTFNCTRCHDHKFDPFTQKDYYSLKAFFSNVPELGKSIRQNNFRFNSPPYVILPASAIDEQLRVLREKKTLKENQLEHISFDANLGFEEWRQRIATKATEWMILQPLDAQAEDQKPKIDVANSSVYFEYLNNTIMDTTVRTLAPRNIVKALRLTCEATDIAATFNFTELTIRVQRGQSDPVDLRLRPAECGNSINRDMAQLTNDGSRETRVPLKATLAQSASIVFELVTPLDLSAEPAEFIFVVGSYGSSSPTKWRFEATASPSELLLPATITQSIAKSLPSPDDEKHIRSRFALQQPAARLLEDEITLLHRRIVEAERNYSTSMVMEELEKPRDTFILIRGAYDKLGERVTATTPTVLPPMAKDFPRNRLGLARWLVSSDNPLTARVTVNRYWQAIFGVGLVKTSEDFGSRGDPPVNLPLLDWLATEFVRLGWDVKAIIRLIVTSSTYKQQSHFTPQLLEHDPENRLLARGARFRIQGEFIRDQALLLSGLLTHKIGGPSVYPYHPLGLYEGVAPTSEDTVKVYIQGHGQDLYRRTLYTYWKRSVPHPAMLAFDVPFREMCTVKRPRTNTPSQALNLMNDPTYVEAARFIAQRMIREGGVIAKERLSFGYRLVLGRNPTVTELAVLQHAFVQARADFARDPASAAAFLSVGESHSDASLEPVEFAAYANVASTLLCLDETVTRQ